jgi:hypothetical protein
MHHPLCPLAGCYMKWPSSITSSHQEAFEAAAAWDELVQVEETPWSWQAVRNFHGDWSHHEGLLPGSL